jgi:hypothetical protein
MLADSREMFLWDCQIRERENYNAGLAEGHTAGAAEKNLEIARKLKERGFSAQDIADTTDLSLSEIEKL